MTIKEYCGSIVIAEDERADPKAPFVWFRKDQNGGWNQLVDMLYVVGKAFKGEGVGPTGKNDPLPKKVSTRVQALRKELGKETPMPTGHIPFTQMVSQLEAAGVFQPVEDPLQHGLAGDPSLAASGGEVR